ncbi:LysR substrate-binding domain-containing protein [Roseovarius sp. MBR-6]|uniref:LysR substrate-binding domain-containing protein n=1 Tax=Roseovarius sp. MBR-6 TaxID=3156459 RepID=UPI0033954BD1
MAKPPFTLVQLSVLEAIARCGGIGAAARDLGLSQPSVSNHLSQIEEKLRARLFDRSGHRLEANALLMPLLPRLRALLQLSDEVADGLGGLATLDSGRLAIGYTTHQFIMDILATFRLRHPGVRIEARCHGSHDLLEGLRHGAFEACFVTLPEPEPDLVCLELRREDVVLMVGRDSALATRAQVSWSEVGTLDLIRREGASGTRRLFDAYAARQGVSLRTAIDLGSWESMRLAAAQGVGVGIAMAGEIEPDDPRIVAVTLQEPVPRLGHYLVTLPEQRDMGAVAALFEIAGLRKRAA